jgi:acyl carrier protein
MRIIRKLSDTPEWPQIRDQLRKAGFDPNAVAKLGEAEADSLDHIELIMAFGEAFNIELKIDSQEKTRIREGKVAMVADAEWGLPGMDQPRF